MAFSEAAPRELAGRNLKGVRFRIYAGIDIQDCEVFVAAAGASHVPMLQAAIRSGAAIARMWNVEKNDYRAFQYKKLY